MLHVTQWPYLNRRFVPLIYSVGFHIVPRQVWTDSARKGFKFMISNFDKNPEICGLSSLYPNILSYYAVHFVGVHSSSVWMEVFRPSFFLTLSRNIFVRNVGKNMLSDIWACHRDKYELSAYKPDNEARFA